MKVLLAVSLLLARLSRAQDDIESAVRNRLVTPVTNFPCTRLINVSKFVGCSSQEAGVTGFLYLAETDAQLGAFMSLGGSELRAVIVAPGLLTFDNLMALSKRSWFAGVLVAEDLLVR